jgi:hypothetical protein
MHMLGKSSDILPTLEFSVLQVLSPVWQYAPWRAALKKIYPSQHKFP